MQKPLLGFYGDDFTGSTDVMEAMAVHGVSTVLFTRVPTMQEFSAFAGYQAFGIAGTSRSQTPAWMETSLPPVFAWLRALRPRFCHYKVCSTFDSAPHVGSIGRAIEIGRRVFGQGRVPLVVGAPQLKRYTAFGNLFAGYQGQTYRIDRHPVMAHHPVTPMAEADLRVHLAAQTSLPVALVPANLLASTPSAADVDACLGDPDGIVMFDVFDAATQLETGRQLLRLQPGMGSFVAGSSGVEYALVRALAAAGEITGMASFDTLPPVDRVIAVSGSCSPTTARQIRHAQQNGFDGIEADPIRLATEPVYEAETIGRAVAVLQSGRSVLVSTAQGEGDRGTELDAIPGARHGLGKALGNVARAAIARCGLRRAILAGGDTSSHALGQLDVFALTTRFPLKATPGSPLCVAHSGDPALNGLEIAMKGGQVGADDYFVALRDGRPAA